MRNKKLDEFLAAPENLKKNKAELKKAKDRKAKEAARRAREMAGKSTEKPSIEDILADIVRVAEDKDTNPFHEFRSISARRYEIWGYYPMAFLVEEFGTFSHALEVAGLRDQPGTRLLKSVKANASRRAHATRYFERYVSPYVGDTESVRMAGRSFRILSISDLHSTLLDPYVWLAFLSAVRDLRPDAVVLNGDVMDLVSLGRHPKVPGHTPDLQLELDFCKALYRELRKVHEGYIWDVMGNHDIGVRLSAHLTQVDPAMASLRCLRVDELLGWGEHGVELFHGGQLMSPVGTEDQKSGALLFGCYRITHGTRLGQTPALAELRAAGRSGQSGHVHRAGLAYGTTEALEGMSWLSTPMAATQAVGKFYIKGVTAGWTRGFGYCEITPTGGVHQYPVVVQCAPDGSERISVEGFAYTRTPGMGDPNPMENWMDDERWQL